MLRAAGALVGPPRPITHPVKFYERGDRPLEIVSTRQWYIRNGGRDPDLRKELLELGRRMRWVPEHMRHRYENWVGGLTGDWLISRQRYLGPPFPVWYRLDAHGQPDYTDPLTPDESTLPVDPWTDVPDGYTEARRGQPGGFVGDPDVMDTWATSSLSPQIAGGWEADPDLFARVFPMDLRPQAHEIIRTWLFSTIVRSRAEHGVIPWHTADISGWVIEDGSHRKVSKSLGAEGPEELLDTYGSDALRYWAANGRPGVDTIFDEAMVKVGRRLAVKLLNAARFELGLGPGEGAVNDPLDLALLARLRRVVTVATGAFVGYDHTGALAATETFFWEFCDDYVELVKQRAYGEGPRAVSARTTLRLALDVQLRLFAPFLPFVTEEIWSWCAAGSVHRSTWPDAGELLPGGDEDVLTATRAALAQIRRAKSERRLSMRTGFSSATVSGPATDIERISLAAADLQSAGRIGRLEFRPARRSIRVDCVA
jgi:valyl-tRNA synthetase